MAAHQEVAGPPMDVAWARNLEDMLMASQPYVKLPLPGFDDGPMDAAIEAA